MTKVWLWDVEVDAKIEASRRAGGITEMFKAAKTARRVRDYPMLDRYIAWFEKQPEAYRAKVHERASQLEFPPTDGKGD